MLAGEVTMSGVKVLSKKVVLLGDPSVGKTSMVQKFVYDIYDDKYISTLGTKITKKELSFDNIGDTAFKLTLLIWDVMGQLDFSKFLEVAFSGCKGAMIVSDITRPETIENIYYWQKSLFNSEEKIPIVVLGNKYDLALRYAKGLDKFNGIKDKSPGPMFLTSAKTGENVENAFHKIGEMMLREDYD